VTGSVRDETLASVRFTPAEAATLLVMAESIEAGRGRVRLDALVENATVETQRAAVSDACSRFAALRPWAMPDDVSKAISRLNRSLSSSPLIARYLAIESDISAAATHYRWSEPLPVHLSLAYEARPHAWPFTLF
jgi:hypothetical protein